MQKLEIKLTLKIDNEMSKINPRWRPIEAKELLETFISQPEIPEERTSFA